MAWPVMDAQTIILLTALASLGAAAWLLPLKWQYAQLTTTFRLWSYSLLCQAVGWFLISLRWSVPLEYSGVPGTILITIAPVIQLKAFAAVSITNFRLSYTYALLALSLGMQVFFGYVIPHTPVRVIWASAFVPIAATQAIYLLLAKKSRRKSRLLDVIAVLYGLVILSVAARVVILVQHWNHPGFDILAGDKSLQWGLILIFLSAFLPTIGFVNLCAEESDSRSAETQKQVEGLTAELLSRYVTIDALMAGISGFAYRCRNDADWTMTFVSSGVEKITGYPASDFVESEKRTFGSIMYAGDVDRVWQACQQSISAKKPCSNEYRIITSSGETIWIWDQAHGVYDAEGRLSHIEGLITDISEKKRIEAENENMRFMYSLISECNRALVTATDSKDLSAAIAKNCVSHPRVKLAWIGYVAPGQDEVEFLGAAGDAITDMERLQIRISAHAPEGQGAAARAMRGARPVVLSSATDAGGGALESGRGQVHFQSYGAFPVVLGGLENAVLVICSDDAAFFTTSHLSLFQQLSQDIAMFFNRQAIETWRSFAEQSIEENRQLLEFALDSTVDAVWDYNFKSGIANFSRNWEEMLGFERGELRNSLEAWEAHIQPDDLRKSEDLLADYVAGRTSHYECTQRMLNKQGEHIWIKERGIIVERDQSGEPVRFVGTLKNIDAAVRQAESARENAILLDAIVENAPVAISLRRNDGTILRANRKLLEYYCISSVDKMESALLNAEYYAPDTLEHLGKKVPSIFRQGFSEQTVTEMIACRPQAGERISWLIVTAHRFDDLDIVVRFGTDITAVKEAELNLRRSESKFRRLFEALPVGVSLHTADRQVIDANPRMCEYAAMPLEALKRGEHRSGRYLHPDGSEITYADLPSTKALREYRNIEAELVAYEVGGVRRWFRLSVILMPEIDMFAAISYDVSLEMAQKAEIERSEIRFRRLFEELPVGVSLHSEDRRILDANKVAMQYLGMNLEQVRAGEALRLHYFDEQGNPLAITDTPGISALRENRNIHRQVIGFDRGSERRWVEMSVTLMPELKIFAVITHDITLERERQRRLLESETKFRTLFEELPVAVTLHTYDRKLVDSNRLAEELTKRSREEMADGIHLVMEFVDTDGRPIPVPELPAAVAVREERNVHGVIVGMHQGKDRIWVEMSAVLMPSIGLMAVIAKDITKLKEQQEELRKRDTKFRKVFSLMPVGLALFDHDKKLIEFNARQAELSGIDGTGLQARVDRKLTYRSQEGEKLSIDELPISRALHDGKPIDDAIFGIETENSVRWVSGSLRPIDELNMFMSILTDVTEILKAREELASANANLELRIAARTSELTEVNAELETFSYSLSHDMKAPLTRIESWANVLMEEYRTALGENGQKVILFLKREISGMHEMIQAMLSLARASRAELISARIDVSSLAAEEFSLLRENYPELKIQFTVEPNLTVNADITLFTSLLRNLLENALKFSSKKPQIQVSVGMITGAENPAFYVRDNGDGFDMRYADRLFGPFQRMHTQKEFPGTGIGLATAQRIVHRHGGRIWVESEKGVGTTVFFSLPSVNTPEEKG